MSTELKPCPFCGSAPNIEQERNYHTQELVDDSFLIVCDCDVACTSGYMPFGKAKEQWNKRV